jgi:hypothetical protein
MISIILEMMKSVKQFWKDKYQAFCISLIVPRNTILQCISSDGKWAN